MRWGNRCISRAKKCSGLALLRVELYEIVSGKESGSRLVVEGRDVARYWRAILMLWE